MTQKLFSHILEMLFILGYISSIKNCEGWWKEKDIRYAHDSFAVLIYWSSLLAVSSLHGPWYLMVWMKSTTAHRKQSKTTKILYNASGQKNTLIALGYFRFWEHLGFVVLIFFASANELNIGMLIKVVYSMGNVFCAGGTVGWIIRRYWVV